MASKDGKRGEMMSLRSSRRVKTVEERDGKGSECERGPNQPDSNDHHNQIEEHKQQQISPKNEKESTSPPNNDQQATNIAQDKSRRVTRSAAMICKKICRQVELHSDPLTPDENPISKVEQQATSKKMLKLSSCMSLPENVSHDLTETVKKSISRVVESLVSPYSEVRKSYRKLHKKEIKSIPYRKCHDPFEGRIVTIINKIESGKNCLRDFESLIEKMQRITSKDMMNRFIIAGIKTIIKLSREKDIYEFALIQRLEREEAKLRERIVEELDRIDQFEQSLLAKNQEFIDSRQYRGMLIRKIYRIMKVNGQGSAREMREKAMSDCQKFFNCETNVGSLIHFIKEKMQILND